MRKALLLAFCLPLIAPCGCAAYLTHKEIGLQRLIGLDLASTPTGNSGFTVPLTPVHQTPAPPLAPQANMLIPPAGKQIVISYVDCNPCSPCQQAPKAEAIGLPKVPPIAVQGLTLPGN